MSKPAVIALIGQPRGSLLAEIAAIRAWDNGNNYPIVVSIDNGINITDTIDNVESAIKNNLAEYLESKFSRKRMILKSGGHDDLFYVPDPNLFDEDNHFKKMRHRHTNLTPKKKKRKK